MGDLTRNISREEMCCPCCGHDTADIETVTIVQGCCDHFAKKLGVDNVVLTIHKGCKCFSWVDLNLGGDDAQHIFGRAIDFSIENVSLQDTLQYLQETYPQYRSYLHDKSVHTDTETPIG